MDRGVNALRDMYDWASVRDGPVVDVGGADGAVSLLLAQVSQGDSHISFLGS